MPPVRSAVVVVFLNEAQHLPTFLASMAAQTRPPDQLLLVDDGSVDDSVEIAEAFAAEHPYARVARRPQRPAESDRLATAAELRAFHMAVQQLDDHWNVVAKVDADLELRPNHLETVLAAIEADPKLGVVGAYLRAREADGTLERERHPAYHVRGPNKFYRRACFEQIEPLPEILGWDTIDEIRARSHGWRTTSVALEGGDSVHLRPTGAHGGRLRAYRRWGLCAWGYGSHPLSVMLGSVYRLRQRPYVISGLNYLWGYVHAALRRAPQVDAETKRYNRREEKDRILRMLGFSGIRN
jgi:biofilm PGA synthesis N-glycosyltransferase PgaC